MYQSDSFYCSNGGRIIVTPYLIKDVIVPGDCVKLKIDFRNQVTDPVSLHWYLNDKLKVDYSQKIKDMFLVFEAKVSKIPFLCKFRYL